MMYRWIGVALEREWPVVKAEDAPTADELKEMRTYAFFDDYTEDALRAAKDDIVLIAEREGLTAHANAIKVRFE